MTAPRSTFIAGSAAKVLAVIAVVGLAAAGGWVIASGTSESDGQTPAPSGGGEDPTWRSRQVRTLCPAISESSGLVAGRLERDALWTHNDSGAPVLFRLGRSGCNPVAVTGAEMYDWEDAAAGPPSQDSTFYIGDIGDNLARRSEIAVYLVPEPRDGATSVAVTRTLRLRYPRGARDAETLMVDPVSGDIVIVTKEDRPAVYVAQPPFGDEVIILEKVGRFPFPEMLPGPTGGDVTTDGTTAVVVGYSQAYLFAVDPDVGLAESLLRRPETIGLPVVRQREAVAWAQDGTSFYWTSEGNRAPLVRTSLEDD